MTVGVEGSHVWIEASNATRSILGLKPGTIVSTPRARLVVEDLAASSFGPDVDACRVRLRLLGSDEDQLLAAALLADRDRVAGSDECHCDVLGRSRADECLYTNPCDLST